MNRAPRSDRPARAAASAAAAAAAAPAAVLPDEAALVREAAALAGTGGWALDLRHRSMRWTEGVHRVLGLEAGAERPGVGLLAAAYAPESRARLRAAMRRLLRHSTPMDLDLELRRADGRRGWVRVTGRPQFEGGQLVGVVGAVVDVTARRRVEHELEGRNEMFAAIGRMQSMFMTGAAPPNELFDALLTELLRRSCSQYGFLGEILYDPRPGGEPVPYLRTYALTNIAWDDATRRFYDEHAPNGLEFRNLNTLFGAAMRTGATVFANRPAEDPRRGGLPPGHPPLDAFIGIPLHHGGQMVAMAGLANRPGGYDAAVADELQPLLDTVRTLVVAHRAERDRATAEAALTASEVEMRRLAAVAHNTGNAVMLTDREGRIEWVNDAFERLTGWARDEALGKTPETLLHGADTDPGTVALIRDGMRRGVGLRGKELLNYHRSGAAYWVEVELQPVHDAGGQIVQFMWLETEVTLRKAAQQALRESQAKLSAAFQGTTDYMTVSRLADGVLVEVNEAFERLTGYSRGEAIGSSEAALDLWAEPEQRERFVTQLQQHGTARDFTYAVRTQSGAVRECLLSATVIEIRGESHLVSVARDLTDQHLAQRALRESQARFTAAFRQSAEYMSIVRLSDGIIVEVNEACMSLTGYQREQVLGHTTLELGMWPHPEEQQGLRQALARDGVVRDMPVHLRRRSGEVRNVLVTSSRLDIDGAPHMLSVVRDVTDSRRTERALVESESRMRLMFENAVDAIVVIDEYGRIELFNPASERLFGYRSDEVIGSNVSVLMPEPMRAEHDTHLQRHRRTGQRRAIGTAREVVALRKNGEQFPVELSVSEIMTAAGKRFSGTVRDITARREVEQAARRLTEELQHSVAELEQINRENGVLGEMRDMLQTCQSVEETHAVAARFVRGLFPEVAGALYMRSGERDLFESVLSWGTPHVGEDVFDASACWALRRGRTYRFGADGYDLRCTHVHAGERADYLCVPLSAQGEISGMLHLQGAWSAGRGAGARSGAGLERLAETLTEHLSLAIANVRLRETLHRQAIRDTGTGLFNRRFLDEALERELRRAIRKSRPLAVCMIDVDHFKRFNDTYGHEAGDTVLRAVADLLARNIRREDYACRFGGEEFVLLLPECTLEGAAARADSLRRMVTELGLEHRGASLGPVTISVGVAAFPQCAAEPAALVAAADQALYEAKRAGRNRVIVAAPARASAELDRGEDEVIVV